MLVAHDSSGQTAYSYAAAAHPQNVTQWMIMDFPYLCFLCPEVDENRPWWFTFHQTPKLPESLVKSKERKYVSWFFKGLAYYSIVPLTNNIRI